MSSDVVITLVGFLHNLITALWIGGMGTMLYAILPALKGKHHRTPEKVVITILTDGLTSFNKLLNGAFHQISEEVTAEECVFLKPS